jgi:hypothetical protein
MKKFKILVILAFIFSYFNLNAEGTAGTNAQLETLYIVDMPTAGVNPVKTIGVNSLFMSEGGLLLYINYSPFKRFNCGISYSGNHIIGSEKMLFQKYPGFQISYRIIDEKLKFPAILIGVNTQGRGTYFADAVRHTILSPGVYIATSKNFKWDAGYIALHAGVNFSFDQNGDKKLPNFYFGAEQSIGTRFAINAEYNACIDERNTGFRYPKSIGTLNARIRCSLAERTTIDIAFKDIFGSSTKEKPIQRYIGIDYVLVF